MNTAPETTAPARPTPGPRVVDDGPVTLAAPQLPQLLDALRMIADMSDKATPRARRESFLGDIGRIARAAIAKATNQ